MGSFYKKYINSKDTVRGVAKNFEIISKAVENELEM